MPVRHRLPYRRNIVSTSVNEALILIAVDALKWDLEELSDEDQPCSATNSEEEQDSVVDNNGLPSPKLIG